MLDFFTRRTRVRQRNAISYTLADDPDIHRKLIYIQYYARLYHFSLAYEVYDDDERRAELRELTRVVQREQIDAVIVHDRWDLAPEEFPRLHQLFRRLGVEFHTVVSGRVED
jgi:hypothetical protein